MKCFDGSSRAQQTDQRVHAGNRPSQGIGIDRLRSGGCVIGANRVAQALLVSLCVVTQASALPDGDQWLQLAPWHLDDLSKTASFKPLALVDQSFEWLGREGIEVLPLVAPELKPVSKQESKQEAHCAKGESVRGDECIDVRHGALLVLLNLALAILGAFCSPVIGSRYDVDLGDLWRRWFGRAAPTQAQEAAHG